MGTTDPWGGQKIRQSAGPPSSRAGHPCFRPDPSNTHSSFPPQAPGTDGQGLTEVPGPTVQGLRFTNKQGRRTVRAQLGPERVRGSRQGRGAQGRH